MDRSQCEKGCPLVNRELTAGSSEYGDRSVTIHAGERAENLVHKDLQLGIVFFAECCTVSCLFIITFQPPDVSNYLDTVVHEGEEDALSNGLELLLGHDEGEFPDDACSLR